MAQKEPYETPEIREEDTPGGLAQPTGSQCIVD
jgi:hypothetical protein